ncbi:hypothetical protein [Streptomyces sp. NPDC056190]|uniref:hypothetical protein n=1 Tax=Streptomyces sp. NPDC056190 TaxID=3345741 RepID=UPI0035DCA046
MAGFGNGLLDFVNPDANCNQSSGTATPPIYDQYKNTVTGSSAEEAVTGGHQPIYSSGKAGNNMDRYWEMMEQCSGPVGSAREGRTFPG